MLQIKLIPTLLLTLTGLAIAPLVLPAIAHQQHQNTTTGDGIKAMIHLDPNDSPPAGEASETWFMLTTANGENLPLANCNCQAAVYDVREQAIAPSLPLSATMVHGQAAIGTAITFPNPGSYRVVLSGEAQDGSFEPFEIRFPVTAVGSTSMY